VFGKGAPNGARTVDVELLDTRLGPEARRDMRQPQMAFGSIRTWGLAFKATTPAVLAAVSELDAEVARKQTAKATVQAAKVAKDAAVIEFNARLVAEAAAPRSSRQFQERKRSLRARAERARAAAGEFAPHMCLDRAVVAVGALWRREGPGGWRTWPSDRPCWWLDGFRGPYIGLASKTDRGCHVAV